jgi:hypothetical protein
VLLSVKQFVFGLAIVLALPFFGIGSTARAGYMPTPTDGTAESADSQIDASKDLLKKATSQEAEQPGAGQASDSSPLQENHKPEIQELPDNPFARLNPSTGGCSSGASSPSNSAGVPVSANLTQPFVSPVMVSWLSEEDDIFSPSPIASGLFHPPRA